MGIPFVYAPNVYWNTVAHKYATPGQLHSVSHTEIQIEKFIIIDMNFIDIKFDFLIQKTAIF